MIKLPKINNREKQVKDLNMQHNHSQSNLSLPSAEKNLLKFPGVIDSVSPVSYVKNMKKSDMSLSQYSAR